MAIDQHPTSIRQVVVNKIDWLVKRESELDNNGTSRDIAHQGRITGQLQAYRHMLEIIDNGATAKVVVVVKNRVVHIGADPAEVTAQIIDLDYLEACMVLGDAELIDESPELLLTRQPDGTYTASTAKAGENVGTVESIDLSSGYANTRARVVIRLWNHQRLETWINNPGGHPVREIYRQLQSTYLVRCYLIEE